jgi:sugar phosphate isomerase/epimerase
MHPSPLLRTPHSPGRAYPYAQSSSEELQPKDGQGQFGMADPRRQSRRGFLGGVTQVIGAASLGLPSEGYASQAASADRADLEGLLGVTTGSFMRHLVNAPAPGKLYLLDLPQILRDRLDLQVIDLMTATLPSVESSYLEALRSRAERAGCIITNLKLNQPEADIGSNDRVIRERSLQLYYKSIDQAELLGCRWVRPLPKSKVVSWDQYVDAYRRLIDYARPKGIGLLAENFGWMQNDPQAIPSLLAAVGEGIAASPDTGNWTDAARYEGLRLAFPRAVTCDFKFFELDSAGNHHRYDLERCFRLGWEAGFRGPWCFEHFHDSLEQLWKDLIAMRDQLQRWMQA